MAPGGDSAETITRLPPLPYRLPPILHCQLSREKRPTGRPLHERKSYDQADERPDERKSYDRPDELAVAVQPANDC